MRNSRKIPFQFFFVDTKIRSKFRLDVRAICNHFAFVPNARFIVMIIIYGQHLWARMDSCSKWHACQCRINKHSDTMLCNHFIIFILFSLVSSSIFLPNQFIYAHSVSFFFFFIRQLGTHRVFLTLIRRAERNYYLISSDRAGARAPARMHGRSIQVWVQLTGRTVAR